MKKYAILLICLSTAQFSYGQLSFFTGAYFHQVQVHGVYSDTEGAGIDIGFLKNSSKLVGLTGNISFDVWSYTSVKTISDPVPAMPFEDEIQIITINKAFSAGIGPALRLEAGEFTRLRLEATYQFSHQESEVNYYENRLKIIDVGGNHYSSKFQSQLNHQQEIARENTTFFKITAGFDYIDSVLPGGIDIGWQGLDFGKSLNSITSPDKFRNEKFNIRSSMVFIGFRLYL